MFDLLEGLKGHLCIGINILGNICNIDAPLFWHCPVLIIKFGTTGTYLSSNFSWRLKLQGLFGEITNPADRKGDDLDFQTEEKEDETEGSKDLLLPLVEKQVPTISVAAKIPW